MFDPSSPNTSGISTPSTPPFSTPTQPPPSSTFHHFVIVKLTEDDYLVWRAQILPYLYGQQLFGYIDGSIPSPPSKTPAGLPNPAYNQWFQQDQLVLSILLASLIEKLIPRVLRHKTSKSLWNALATLFSQQTQARLVHLHQQITNLKKGGDSISDYHRRATILVDSLAAAGKPIDDIDFITYFLAGLGPDFDSIVTSLTTQRHSLSIEEILSHLLTFEARLTQHHSIQLPPEISANAVSKSPASSSSPNNFRGGRAGRFSFNRSGGRSFRGSFRGGRGWSSRGGGRFSSFHSDTDSDSPCQLCKKFGHTTHTCFQRYNQALQAPPPPSLAAHYSEYSSQNDSLWYSDIGVTHHMTNDFSTLNLSAEPHLGNDTVHVSNGSPMPIQHQGSGLLPTPSGNFLLSNLLHVPTVTKNLMCVNQFCEDNDAFFEFHSKFFCVKDERTQKILLQGPKLNRMYPFISFSSPQAHFGVRTSLLQWHHRLGHPAIRTVSQVLSSNSLPVSNKSISHPCFACRVSKSHRLPSPASPHYSLFPSQLVFCDVWGPSPTISVDGFRYYVCFIDDYSKYIWFYPL